MKAFLGATLIVCVLVVAIAIIGQRIRKARSLEAEIALSLEEEYRTLTSFRLPESMSLATQTGLIDVLATCLDPKYRHVFKSPQLTYRVEAARILAVSNIVARLEAYSGMSYGTNIQAWQDWLKAQPPEGNRQEKPGQ